MPKRLNEIKKVLDVNIKNMERRKEVLEGILAELNSGKTLSAERLEGFFSHIVSYKLMDFIEQKNWFVGVVISAAILEDVGKRKLKGAFKNKIDSNKIENLTLEQTIMMLFASGLIDAKIYQKLMDIKKVRNDLAHNSVKAMSSVLMKDSTKEKICQRCKSAIKRRYSVLKQLILHLFQKSSI